MITEQITWLYVADLEKSRTFYAEALGLAVILEQSSCCILQVSSTAYVGLCERPPPRETPGLLLCFVVPDVSKAAARMLEAGAVLDTPPQHNPTYAITHAFLRDPDGHRLEVQRFDDPMWNRR